MTRIQNVGTKKVSIIDLRFAQINKQNEVLFINKITTVNSY